MEKKIQGFQWPTLLSMMVPTPSCIYHQRRHENRDPTSMVPAPIIIIFLKTKQKKSILKFYLSGECYWTDISQFFFFFFFFKFKLNAFHVILHVLMLSIMGSLPIQG